MNDIEKLIDDIKKVYEIRMEEYPIRTMNLITYAEDCKKLGYTEKEAKELSEASKI